MAKLVFVAVFSVIVAVCFGTRLIGAPRQMTENDNGVQEALRVAMYEYNKASNDMYQSRPVRVHNATMQVVNGIKYDMFVDVKRTVCRKPVTDVKGCAFHDTPSLAETTVCHFVVLNRMWASEITLEINECN
ncbi:cystatin-C [Pyxicephalus adspersus]|uniref:Cystatin domain-containing protein n=1 Tax=Pyxicephalus adspersus TaxID=30357 RepID=A0AAV3AJ54_PYXAD|nr:TPA: hypothetical protein GDO54_010760 [Pyxicephalus adspersus]